MESKIIKAKSSDEAVRELLKDENVDRASVEVITKEKPSKGFLGLGAKSGTFELRYELISESEKAVEATAAISEEVVEEMEEEKNEPLNEGEEIKEEINITEEKKITGEDEIRIARDFIEGLLEKADVKADVDVKIEDNLIKIHITGGDASSLIGRRGETLDSIQFLTGLALNKVNKNSSTRVYIDIEDYRSKREESLKRYCYKAAREVARTRRTRKLDYMNPYERRIIHSALQNDRYVITYSEGTDPYRRVVIEYKNK